MSDIDLSAAKEAAARAFYDAAGVHIDTFGPGDAMAARHCMSAAIVTAAPLIEAQVRAQIAADIEAKIADLGAPESVMERLLVPSLKVALEKAASIARGDS